VPRAPPHDPDAERAAAFTDRLEAFRAAAASMPRLPSTNH